VRSLLLYSLVVEYVTDEVTKGRSTLWALLSERRG